jgi:hypothetical protein
VWGYEGLCGAGRVIIISGFKNCTNSHPSLLRDVD